MALVKLVVTNPKAIQLLKEIDSDYNMVVTSDDTDETEFVLALKQEMKNYVNASSLSDSSKKELVSKITAVTITKANIISLVDGGHAHKE